MNQDENNIEISNNVEEPLSLRDDKKGLIELFIKYRSTHDKEIREKIITENLDLVYPISRKFHSSGESFEDLLQVGYIGLIKAVDHFEPDRGVKFSTYATHCIKGEIRHYLRDKSEIIKKPRWLKIINSQVSAFIEGFLQKNQRLPTIKEISKSLNIAEDGIFEILKSHGTISLNELSEPFENRINYYMIKSLSYETFKLPIEDRIVIENAIEKLRQIEKRIIYLFFYVDLTQTKIAQDLGLSQKKVSRMLAKTIEKLKEAIFPKK